MRFNDVIDLISEKLTYDNLGNAEYEETPRKVYANNMMVSRNEFYQADQSGLKPQKQFELYSFEYENESIVEHNSKRYTVLRVQTKGDKTVLVCGDVVGERNVKDDEEPSE